MTWIKICGITNVEDALAAIEAGADALGFIFYHRSPRNVDCASVREIIRQLPREVEKVGVFVNESTARPQDIALSAGLTAIQHQRVGGQSYPEVDTMGCPVVLQGLKLFISLPAAELLNVEAQRAREVLERVFPATPGADGWFDTLFLDSGTTDKPGGTGKAFDWQKAAPIAEEIKRRGLNLVVSGGLNAGNVTRAIELLQPWGVDVASGVESAPGKKDVSKVRNFISAVRKVESRGLTY